MPPISNPLLFDFPDHIETERLLIRSPRPGDGPSIDEAIRESFAELNPWMPWARTLQTPEETETFIRHAAANFIRRDVLPLLLFRKADGRYMGGSGMHNIDWSVPRFEIGYWLR